MSADVVGVIEAAYAGEGDDASWLRRVAERAAPALDRGLGLLASLYDLSEGPMRFEGAIGLGVEAHVIEAVGRANAGASPELLRRLYLQGPACNSGALQSGMSVREWRRHPDVAPLGAATGMFDALGIVSGDPSGVGCLLFAPVRGLALVPRDTKTLWTRIAAHLAAALRLRRGASEAHAVEAVLSPSGRLEHAESPAQGADARAALAGGAVRIERARGKLRRRDPDEAVEIWRALVAGRWSLVDHIDHDGRRFLVARRNEPACASRLGELTPQERETLALAALGHTNKLIAYQLGLSSSAVAMRLSRVATKLRVRSRLELIAAWRSAADPNPEGSPRRSESQRVTK